MAQGISVNNLPEPAASPLAGNCAKITGRVILRSKIHTKEERFGVSSGRLFISPIQMFIQNVLN